MTQQKMRDKTLRERGLELKGGLRVEIGRPGEFTNKTPTMLLIEARTGEDIRKLIKKGTVRSIGRRLGVNYTTICRWRKALGMD